MLLTDTNTPSNKELMSLLFRALNSKKLTENTFIYRFFKQQLECLNKTDQRDFVWDEEVVHWAFSLQYHWGKLTLETLRGASSKGLGVKGRLPVDSSKWGIFLPSPSTLGGYLPLVDPYKGIDIQTLQLAKDTLHRGGFKSIGIVSDKMEICHGFQFFSSTDVMLGADDGPIYEKDARKVDWEEKISKMATHILQLFLVSTDGRFSMPLGFVPMAGLNGDKMFGTMLPIFNFFEQTSNPISIDWGSSDGFSAHSTYLNQEAGFTKYVHIFDPVHVVKNLRNALLNGSILSPECPQGFSLQTLGDLRNSSDADIRKIFREVLPHEHCVYPDDKMNVDNVILVSSEKVTSRLLNLPLEEHKARSRGKYLENIRIWYACWNDNEIPLDQKIVKLENVVKYFQSIQDFNSERQKGEESVGKLGSNLFGQIVTSLESLKILIASLSAK
eukprot:Pompholyxophrys_punicea_v1_NODE_394_length_2057_cov_16.152888.p1 type:complete len:443 gc:universal NODE_394_length_2057_cov_16.152888:385-1713(+)